MTDRTITDRQAVTDADLHPLLAGRWSPRGFDTVHTLSEADLATLLEAARWAPSCGNSQPWRFLLTRRGEAAHARLTAQLAEGNRRWTASAAALIVAAATVVDDAGEPLPLARYDTGQAAAHLTVQAAAMDLMVHQMAGFDADGVAAEFGLPAAAEPVAVLAIGRWDPDAALPEDLRAREYGPRMRRPLTELLLPT